MAARFLGCWFSALVAGILSSLGPASAAVFERTVSTHVQIVENFGVNDVADSSFINFGGDTPVLAPGDMLIVNYFFEDEYLRVDDTFPTLLDSESINFTVLGNVVQSPSPPPLPTKTFALEYDFSLISAVGDVHTNPVTGRALEGTQGIIEQRTNNAINIDAYADPDGDPSDHVSVDLTDSSFCLAGFRLKINAPGGLPAAGWQIQEIRLQLDADQFTRKPINTLINTGGGFVDFSEPSNWSRGVAPNGTDEVVRIPSNVPATDLFVPPDHTIGILDLSTPNTISITGSGLTLDASTGAAGIVVNDGQHTVSAPTLSFDDVNIHLYGENATIDVSGDVNEIVDPVSISVIGNGMAGQRVTLSGDNDISGVSVERAVLSLDRSTAQGPVGETATARNGGQIDLGFTPTPQHQFNVERRSMISGDSTQLQGLDTNTNLTVEDDAIIGFQENSSMGMPANTDPTRLFYGVASNSLTENITIGADSGSFKGIYGAPGQESLFDGTVTIEGNVEFGALDGGSLTVPELTTGPAEFVNFAGGVVNVVSKSTASQLSGELYVGVDNRAAGESGDTEATVLFSNPAGEAITATGNTTVGSGTSMGAGARSTGRGMLSVTGASAVLDDLLVGVAFSELGEGAGEGSVVGVLDTDFGTRNAIVGSAISSGGEARAEGQMNIDADGVSHRLISVASAQVSGGSEASSAHVLQGVYEATADQYVVTDVSLTVGSVSFSAIPDGLERIAQVDLASATIVANDVEVPSVIVGTVSGFVDGHGTVGTSKATIQANIIAVNGTLTAGSATLASGASAVVESATLWVKDGTLTVSPSGPAALRTAAITTFGTTPPGQPVEVHGNVTLHNVDATLNGSVEVGVTNLLTAVDPASSIEGVLVLENSDVEVNGDVLLGGDTGVATIDSGVAIMRLSPNFVRVNGDLSMSERALLEFAIEGLLRPASGVPGTFGAIDAANATLDGELALTFDFPAVELGDSFELVRLDPGGMFDGFFEMTTSSGLPAGLTAMAEIVGESVVATVVARPPLPGDFNQDGKVNAADYTVFEDNIGSQTALPNDDGLGTPVRREHYDLWVANFGMTADASALGKSQNSPLPEPASGWLLLVGLIACRWRINQYR